jgi:hypothetical protein
VLERAHYELIASMVPRRRAPVHVADIVAGQVRTKFAELETLSALTDQVRARDRPSIALAQAEPVAIEL